MNTGENEDAEDFQIMRFCICKGQQSLFVFPEYSGMCIVSAVNADLKNDIELDEVVNLEKTKQNYSRSRSNSISQKIGLHFVGLCILRIPMASNLES